MFKRIIITVGIIVAIVWTVLSNTVTFDNVKGVKQSDKNGYVVSATWNENNRWAWKSWKHVVGDRYIEYRYSGITDEDTAMVSAFEHAWDVIYNGE